MENLSKKIKRFFWKAEDKIEEEVKKEAVKVEEEIKEDIEKIEEKVKEDIEKIEEFVEYEETRFARWGYSLLKKILGPIIRWIWIHEIKGLENVPKDGRIIVASNHESYFDFICFIAVSPRKIHYLSAEKFYKSKFWKPLMEVTGQIKVDRENHDKTHTHKIVLSALKQERMIGIFPEGTRSRDGKMLKAYTGAAKFALKTKTPILPVGVIGTRDIMAPHDKRPKFVKIAKIRIGEPMHFHEHYDKEHTEEIFREVTDKVMLKIAELAEKEYPHIEKN